MKKILQNKSYKFDYKNLFQTKMEANLKKEGQFDF